MAGKSTINITFKLDSDGKGFKDLANDAEGLKKVITATVTEAQQLKGNVINFAALATGIDAAQRSFNQLHGGMKELADAYAVQETNETRLATVMKQRMSATEAEIQSIKDLASAQQQIGVIGDEVQLSGAQQIATFLDEKESLETLLPAMNNLLAQQKGLNASAQDAISVGNLMGKVMQGQASSLREVGITFTAAEEAVLKYGTESERAAMLAQVITNNVGNMNAQLALTDAGKQQQLVNALGDIKEEIGGMVNGALPFVTIAAQSTQALSSITTLVTGVKTLSSTIYASAKAFAVSTAAFVKNKVAALAVAAAQKVVAAASAAWAGVQKILNMLLTANPIGLIITAIGALVTALVAAYNNCEGFRQIVDDVWEAIKPLANAIMNGLAKAFAWLVEKCKEAWAWLKNILGLSGKKVEVEVDVKTKGTPAVDLDGLKNKYAGYKPPKSTPAATATPAATPAAAEDSAGLIGQLEKKIADARARLREATSEAAIEAINKEIATYEGELSRYESLGQSIGEAVADGVENNGPIFNADASTLKDIGGNIQVLTDQLQTATVEEAALINQQIQAWNAKADAIKNAGIEAQKTGQSTSESLQQGWGAIKGMASSVEGITGALNGNGNAWQNVVGIIDGFLGLYEGINAIVGIIELLTAASAAHAVTKGVEAGAETTAASVRAGAAATNVASGITTIATNKAVAASFKELAAAEYMAAHAYIPFAGFGIAMGFTTAMMAAVTAAGIPALANGGIASGPTLAVVGEYAGASGNPEVIAPLDKLRGMLAEPGGIDFSKVQFEIKGRNLVGILTKENNLKKRS